MKKRSIILAMTLSLILAVFMLVACTGTNTYTVTFDTDGGTTVASQTVDEGGNAVKPVSPTKEGYEFGGWYLGESEYVFATPVNKDITLKAHWDAKTYTVTFDTDGGSAVEAQTVEHGKKATEPNTPTKDGYEFGSWYLGESEYDFNTEVSENITLKAHWNANTYMVTFDTDGGSEIEAQPVQHGMKATAPNTPTKEGYEFGGWYLGESEYTFNTKVSGNITLKAHWNAKTYTVTFDSNGGSEVEAQTVEHGNTAQEPTAPTKNGFTLDGWYLGENKYDFSASVTEDVSLTARWSLKDIKPVEMPDEFVGTWTGTEIMDLGDDDVYEFEWVVVIGADGMGTATYEMKPNIMGISRLPLYGVHFDVVDEALVMYYRELENRAEKSLEFEYNGKTLYAEMGPMGAEINLTKEGAEEVEIPDEFVGTWTGNEVADYGGLVLTYNYTVVVNKDGTGSAEYEMDGGYSSELTDVHFNCVDDALVMFYKNYVNDPEKSTTFDFEGTILSAASGPMGGKMTLSQNPVEPVEIPAELVGTWTGNELADYGDDDVYEFAYVIVINADGTGSAEYEMLPSFGYGATALIDVHFAVEGNILVMYYKNYAGNEETSVEFELDGDTLYCETGPMLGEMNLTKEKAEAIIPDEIVGTWTGDEIMNYGSTSYTASYEVVINADGTGKASYDMGLGYPSDLIDVRFEVNGGSLVLYFKNYEGGAEGSVTFEFDGKTLSSAQGPMGGEINLTKEKAEAIIPAEFVGAWTGDEIAYGYPASYEIVINADGTGKATFDMGLGYPSDLIDVRFEVNGGSLVLYFKNYEGGAEESVTFEFDGKTLSSAKGPMGGEINLTKEGAETGIPAEFVGTWTGNELADYGDDDVYEFAYVIVINADGTGSAEYEMLPSFGYGATALIDVHFAVEGDGLVMYYKNYAGNEETSVEFELGGDTLYCETGPMLGEMNLTKED